MFQNQFIGGWIPPLMPTIDDRDIIFNGGSIMGPPGPQGPAGPAGAQGPEGVSVVYAEVTENPGNLVLTLSDGTEINAGNIKGPQGPEGPQGPAGESAICKTKTISSDYTILESDQYIGVDSTNPVKITLINSSTACGMLIIKAEMGAPIGNRKITIVGSIDDKTQKVIQTPYGAIGLIFNNGKWHTIWEYF